MNKKLQVLYSKLEKGRQHFIHEMGMYNTERLESPHKDGKWSVSQIVYHLNQAEMTSINYVRKKLHEPDKLKDTGFNESFRLTVAQLIFETPVRFKAPPVLGEMPEKVDYTIVMRNWDKTRADLKELLESIPEEMLTKNLYRNPGIGRINIYQMVRFMRTHFNRHHRQAIRAVKA